MITVPSCGHDGSHPPFSGSHTAIMGSGSKTDVPCAICAMIATGMPGFGVPSSIGVYTQCSCSSFTASHMAFLPSCERSSCCKRDASALTTTCTSIFAGREQPPVLSGCSATLLPGKCGDALCVIFDICKSCVRIVSDIRIKYFFMHMFLEQIWYTNRKKFAIAHCRKERRSAKRSQYGREGRKKPPSPALFAGRRLLLSLLIW